MAYLDKTGLTYLWSKITAALNGKANFTHTHTKSQITDLSIPTSLPANGGNADTVDNKHVVVSSSAPTTNDTSIITIVV